MDQQAFHRLTTVIATATSRRAAMRAAVAILVGGAGLATTTGASAATCRKGRQTCSRNAQCCSGTCQTGRVIPTRDRNRCTCEAGTGLCGNTCVDTRTNKRHCGACGNACNAGDTCIDGDCRIDKKCFTGIGPGLCYMSADGREHRADGIYFLGPEINISPCRSATDCRDSDEVCSTPGVVCPCVRALDGGNGYVDFDEAGFGSCLPMLDNGDDSVLCQSTIDESVCVYTSESEEVLMCTTFASEIGPCIDGSCAGVGECDEVDGIRAACVCALGFRGLAEQPLPVDIYWPAIAEPTCVGYQISQDGSCNFEA